MSHETPKSKLKSLEANARKSFSQNFLVSPQWTQKLAKAATEDPTSTAVWEIGPGLGAITKEIVKATKEPVTLFEIDRKLAENARQEFSGATVVEGDFLDADIAALAGDLKIALLSNLPYHLSSPILFRLLEFRTHFTRLVLTFQKEVAERLRAKPSTKPYGGLSVLTQLHFEIRSLGVIPPGAFYPVPGVDSEALLFIPRPDPGVDYAELSQIVKTAFAHRRKKITSNLSTLFNKEKLGDFLIAEKLTTNARPEELTPEIYLRLTKARPSMV